MCSLGQAFRKLFQPVEAFLDVLHARRVADAEIVVRAKGDARDGGDLFRLQQPGAKVGGLQPEPGNVREKIKRALRVDARNAGNAVEPLVGVSAAFGILREPDLDVVLRAVERGDRALLRKGGRVAGAVVALDGVNGLRDRFGGAANSRAASRSWNTPWRKPCTMMVCFVMAGEKPATLTCSACRHRRASRKFRRS